MHPIVQADLTVDSRIIAAGCGVEHESAIRLLSSHKSLIEGELGILRFEIGEIKGRGQPQKFAMLTEDQATALITMFRNTDVVVRFKIALSKAFGLAKEHIARNTSALPQTFSEALRALADQFDKNQELEREKTALLPKAEFYDAVTGSTDAIGIGEAAKVLHLPFGRTTLFQKLREKRILMKDNVPLQEYVDRGYFRVVERKFTKPDGTEHIHLRTLVLQKGLDYLMRMFRDLLPMNAPSRQLKQLTQEAGK